MDRGSWPCECRDDAEEVMIWLCEDADVENGDEEMEKGLDVGGR
jgi:hypothetical protein